MQQRMLIVVLVALAGLVSAPHAGATALDVPARARAGQQVVLTIAVPERARSCTVVARSGRARTRVPVLVTGAEMRLAWKVPGRARSARWTVTATCSGSAAARGTLDVSGRRAGPRKLMTPGTLRVSSGGAGRGAGNPFADSIKWCTWHVYNKRPDVYEQSVAKGAPRWGWDAWTWADRAARYGGFPTGSKPMVGAVAVFSREYYGWPQNRGLGATYGHVAYVEAVDAAGYTISEHSGDRRATPNVRRLPLGQPGVTFIYGGPAGNGPAAAPVPDPPPKPQPQAVTLTVDNRVTNGPSEMREDPKPAFLSTRPANYCKRDGCAIAGTDRGSGGTYSPAVCQGQGVRTTNGNDGNANDDANPGLYSSTRWYRIRLPDGSLGWISEVWIQPSQRGGLGLPAC